ncbi:MAG: c-type cytochrome [Candidatus Competibacteraceae bacterium]
MKTLFAIAATFALLGSTAAMAAGDATAGQQKAAACGACHGADGNSANGEWPKLAGQNSVYLVKQLQDFKAGRRANPIMSGMAAPLSDQDMEDLAAYFSAQQPAPGKADPELVEKGKVIYLSGNLNSGLAACTSCHGANGKGNPAAGFPAVSDQHAQYTETQLKAFRTMQRGNDPGQMMRNIAAKMSDDEIKAVASFMQGLK